MADDEERRRPPGRREDYRFARIAAGMTLCLVLGALLVLDAFLDTYELQPTTLVTIGVLIFGLFGIEVRDLMKRE